MDAAEKKIKKISDYHLVKIPSGTFLMGNRFSDGYKHEQPVHEVYLDCYYIGKYCVTVKEYYDFMMNYSNTFQESWCDFTNPCFIFKDGKTYKIWPGAENYPMVGVNFIGAIAYCNWSSIKHDLEPVYNLDTLCCNLSKNGFRLCTEAEWEYASKGPKGCRYSYTNKFRRDLINYKYYAGKFKNYRASYNKIGGFGMHDYSPLPVGKLSPNDFGLHEMLGNIYEWCHDIYGSYSSDKQINPCGDQNGSFRVVRGGCFMDDIEKLHTTYRHAIHYQAKCFIQGFRIAKNKKF